MKRQRKVCIGCAENFLTFKNYDYCKYCEINSSRYVNQKSPCSECDGSGIIKFKHQKPRPCKLCHLTKTPMKKKIQKISAKLSPEEKF
jgi:DnaJ-class molecular chaperone